MIFNASPHIEGWLASFPHLMPSSRICRINPVRMFFADIIMWQWERTPTPYILLEEDSPRVPHLLPKPLSPALDRAVQEILAPLDTLAPMGLLLLRHTGMRIGELIDLDLDALHQARGQSTLRVPLGKTDEERIVPITEQTAELVTAIKAQRGSRLHVKPRKRPRRRLRRSVARYLMVNPYGKHLGPNAYRHALTTHTQHLAPHESIHLHRLRHSYATEMARAGMKIEILMKILGHATPKMTMRYIHLAAEDLRREYDRAINKIQLTDAFAHEASTHPITSPTHTPANPADILTTLIERLDNMRHEQTDANTLRQFERFKKRLWRTQADLKTLLDNPIVIS